MIFESLDNNKYIHSNKNLWIHFILGILCNVIYLYAPISIKLLTSIYPLYLLFRGRIDFFPILILHTISGQTTSYILLVGTIFYAFSNLSILKQLKLLNVFIVALIPLPLIFYNYIFRIIELNYTISLSFVQCEYYLSLFPFFYTAIIMFKVKLINTKYLILSFILVSFFSYFHFLDNNYRLAFVSTPFIFAVVIISSKFSYFKKSLWQSLLAMIAFIFIILDINDASLTTLLSILLTSIISINVIYSNKFSPHKVFKWLPAGVIISIFLLSLSLYNNFENNNYSGDGIIKSEEWDLTNFKQLQDRIIAKAFVDRLPLWISVVKNVFIKETLWLPPEEIKDYTFELITGHTMEISYGAHNLLLELFRTNGIIFGLLIFTLFSYMLTLGAKYFDLKSYRIASSDKLFLLLLVSAICSGFFGALFGQYPLMAQVSFGLLGVVGIGYSLSIKSKLGQQVLIQFDNK